MGELTGHTKRVTDAKFLGHQDLMVTTSADKTSRLWAVDGDAYKCKVTVVLGHFISAVRWCCKPFHMLHQ